MAVPAFSSRRSFAAPMSSRLFAPVVVKIARFVKRAREPVAAMIQVARRVAAKLPPLRALVSPETLALPPPSRSGE